MRITRRKTIDGLTRYQRFYRNHLERQRAKHVRNLASPAYKYARLKAGAKERGLDFEITKPDYAAFWQKPCHYCGSEIERCGIDRIDSKRGYVMGNLVPCCKKCNLMKREYTQAQFVLHCQRIVEFNQPVHT